jgi:hypothetical protein
MFKFNQLVASKGRNAARIKFCQHLTIDFSQLPQSGIGILAEGDSCTGGHRLVWHGPAILKA